MFVRLLFVAAFTAGASSAHAEPGLVPVQGFLYNQTGVPLQGEVGATFALSTSQDGSSPLWTETQFLDVDDGRFSAALGEVSSLDLDLFADHAETFLIVRIGTDNPMNGVPMHSVPYAAHAQVADWSEQSDYAVTAGSADSALLADEATRALLADEATHSAVADSATMADLAARATLSDVATRAISADSASTAMTATTATTADQATSALTAASANTALQADLATNAERLEGQTLAQLDGRYVGRTNGTAASLTTTGTLQSDGVMRILSTQDVGLNANGSLVVGSGSGANIGIDNNEIMARNDGQPTTLGLQVEGGRVHIGSGAPLVPLQIDSTTSRSSTFPPSPVRAARAINEQCSVGELTVRRHTFSTARGSLCACLSPDELWCFTICGNGRDDVSCSSN